MGARAPHCCARPICSSAVYAVAVLALAFAGTVAAQAPVKVIGQVSIQERPGDETEDLGNVVVFLKQVAAPAARTTPAANAVIALQSRQFSPRVRVIPVGTRVSFPNQDPFTHNVFSKTNGGFDTDVYGRGKTKDHTFRDPGVYPLYCNVHPRMTAFVITLDTPLFTQAGADGRFVLENVPPGQYEMHVWHDRATEVVQRITVAGASLVVPAIRLDARGYKYVQHKDKKGREYAARGDRY